MGRVSLKSYGPWYQRECMTNGQQIYYEVLPAVHFGFAYSSNWGDSPKRLKCPLGENVESSKFKRYTTTAEVIDQIQKGQPLPILLFGSPVEWRAGVIIVASNRWYFRELECGIGEDVLDDPYGLAYHRIHLREYEDCFGRVNGDFTQSLGGLPFWDYGIVLPDIIEDVQVFRYGILRSNWQYLDRNCNWSQFD